MTPQPQTAWLPPCLPWYLNSPAERIDHGIGSNASTLALPWFSDRMRDWLKTRLFNDESHVIDFVGKASFIRVLPDDCPSVLELPNLGVWRVHSSRML